MTVEDLIVRLRIEDDNKVVKRRSKGNSTINGAHIVEDDQNNSKKGKKDEQGSNQPKKKFKGKCFNYGKLIHNSTDCHAPKKGKKKYQENMIESNKECDDLCSMFSECNLARNPREWWMDFGATCHVYANKELFSSFASTQVEEMIYMANSATAKVEGTGKICLKMTSGKVLTLNNVLSKRPRDKLSENVHNEENPRRSTRQRTSTSFGSDFVTFLLENEPQIFKEAMSSSDSSFWKKAVNNEIDSILSNHTWELVDLPPRNKPLGSKWIFKRKMKMDGTIDKYKARLVVKGFKQKEGLDYFDIYSPVIRITSIRRLIALAGVYGLEIHQIDVKTTFLNGELEEEIYIEQPEGCVVPGKENKVFRLLKSLYVLKQAPKQWHTKFDQTIDISDINSTKQMLERKIDMKDLGVADVILGIRIHRTPQGLALSQSNYIEKVLDKFKYMEFGIAKTSLDVNFALQKNEVSQILSDNLAMTRRSKGRQRIDIAKMQNESKLQVTFCKRHAGLFKTVSGLCTLCGAEIAIVVFSPGRKVYSFGHPSVELLVDRFLGRNLPPPNNHLLVNHQNAGLRELNKKVMDMEEMFRMEKACGESILDIRRANGGWWEDPINALNLSQLQQLMEAMKFLKQDVEK
ncbi:hypothetical protein CQW23_30665 [Capsicum baccatum]|uniref:MADS-box domain-containing protein n=1 Tax=Capsicum baccatum TaxID=33114 RepID=A0A2G2V9T9_CAPBA|nr:hypothetical protein CQW23_30665 [Capsicum baccatum]